MVNTGCCLSRCLYQALSTVSAIFIPTGTFMVLAVESWLDNLFMVMVV